MAKLNVAVVGAGVGIAHLAAFRALEDRFDITAIVDIDETKLGQAAGIFEIPHAFTSYEEMLALDAVDVVDICTPPDLHFDMCRQGLAAGKHVICEKPLVTSLAECDALAAAEAAAAGRLMPIFQYRFGAGLQKLKHLADKGVLGKCYLSTIETSWTRGEDYYAVEWRGRWKTERGGSLLSHAIHNHDMLCYIVGPPRRVFAHATTRVNPIETEDCAAVSLEMADGSLATLSVTLGSTVEISRLRFCFEALTAESGTEPYTPAEEPWIFKPAPGAETRIQEALADFQPGQEDYVGQFERFHQALATDAAFPVTLADARASLELVTAMYASADAKQPVELPIPSTSPWYKSWIPAAYRGEAGS